MNRAGCYTRGWQGHLRLSSGVARVAKRSKVSSRELLRLLRRHETLMPEFLASGYRVQTDTDWSGTRDRVIASTVCDSRTGFAVTLVHFSWERDSAPPTFRAPHRRAHR